MHTSVYIHFPWCLHKCPYCDFASATVGRREAPGEAYADAVLRELQQRREQLGEATLVSVFFGGGTPSLWPPEALGRVLEGIRDAFPYARQPLEVTVECNPTSLDRHKARALRATGVDRLSLGVQSLNDARLRFLGRLHDAPTALQALDDALQEMPRVSADLMFGMPEQTPQDFDDELQRILRMGVSHVSAYALTIEPDTAFGQLQRQGRTLTTDDGSYAETFLQGRGTAEAWGLSHYEVSNYARAGEEARHNQHYWRGGAYLGLGAGAVGCLHERTGRARRYRNDPDPSRYMARAGTPSVEVFEEHLDGRQMVQEALMLGLRTREGVDLREVEARAGLDPRAERERALEACLARGDVVLEGSRLRVPCERWLHLDSIVAALF